jgi:hypothetical protein
MALRAGAFPEKLGHSAYSQPACVGRDRLVRFSGAPSNLFARPGNHALITGNAHQGATLSDNAAAAPGVPGWAPIFGFVFSSSKISSCNMQQFPTRSLRTQFYHYAGE